MSLKLTLAANERKAVKQQARYITVRDADGNIEVRGRGVQTVTLQKGDSHPLGDQVANLDLEVRNLTAQQNVVVLEFTNEKLEPNQSAADVQSTATEVTNDESTPVPVQYVEPTSYPAGADLALADGATVKLVDADATRLAVYLKTPDALAGFVRWANNSVGAAAGMQIGPAVNIPLPGKGEMWLHNEAGNGAITISFTEVKR